MLSTFLTTLAHYMQMVGLPPQYVWLGPVIIFIFSLALLFSGKNTWRIMTAVIGAVVGYELFIGYVLPIPAVSSFIVSKGLPTPLLDLIVAVLSALIFGWLVEATIVLSIGYAGFAVSSYLSPYILPYVSQYYHGPAIYLWVIIGIFSAIIGIVLYRKLTVLVAAFLGTIGIWYTMTLAGLSTENATYVAIMFLIIGLYYQTHKKEITKKVENASNS